MTFSTTPHQSRLTFDMALAGLLGMRKFYVFLTLSNRHITLAPSSRPLDFARGRLRRSPAPLTLSSGEAAYRRACPEPVERPSRAGRWGGHSPLSFLEKGPMNEGSMQPTRKKKKACGGRSRTAPTPASTRRSSSFRQSMPTEEGGIDRNPFADAGEYTAVFHSPAMRGDPDERRKA